MTTLSLATAFKEWASVVRALGTGEQILILRKGGIHEKFSVDHESFLFFPTFEHQKAEDLNPRGQELLKQTASNKHTDILIDYYARVEEVFWLDSLEQLLKLSDFHVWSENALRKRYEWGPEKGVHAIVVRVYRLPKAHHEKNLAKYGGCRSWVDFESPVSLAGLQPVLPDAQFQQKFAALRRLIA